MRNGRGSVIACLSLLAWLACTATINPPTAEALSCTAHTGQHIAVVIDFGSAPGAPAGIRSQCTPRTSDRMTGVMALRAVVGNQVGFDASGKICQIEGVPSTFNSSNCSAPANGMVSYWAYFHGEANGWTYSSYGAGDWRVTPQVVEGWHFVSTPVGSTSSAQPPRNILGVGPSYLWQSTCAPSTPPSTLASNDHAPVTTPPATAPIQRSSDTQPRTTSVPVSDPSAPTSQPPSPSTTHVATTRVKGFDPLEKERVGLKSTGAAPKITSQQVTTSAAHDSTAISPFAIGGGVLVVGAMAIAILRSRKRRL